MDRGALRLWLDAYIEAWRTYDPERIAALFTEDATYKYHPLDTEPVAGREAIVAAWLENRDDPASWSAEYHPLAFDGDLAVAHGLTQYAADEAAGRPARLYANIWVMRFAPDGRCREFIEWYMEPRRPA
ncbi:MAG TPA: nuclear transport factor 2 family protein [Candidatus Limnocylindria bacterium]|nr:nuclear transport factor 2 family protein [Candidatus Limnocylindria bacterium]